MSSKMLGERIERIELFVSEGLNRKEIAERLGMAYNALNLYLSSHSDLPKPVRKKGSGASRNLEKYSEMKKLLEEGLSQIEIARRLGVSKQAVNEYVHKYNLIHSKENRKG